jgi:1-acyl-sn-glycerol-3-phosphate acyltransferase
MKKNKNHKNNINLFIRSLIFNILFMFNTVIISLLFLPISLFSRKIAILTGYLWSVSSIFLLKFICNIEYQILGKEHIPQKNNFVIAAKHQSTWDTIFFLKEFYNPAYILKKELLFIPFFGQYLLMMDMLYINRNNARDALQKISKKAQLIVNKQRRNLVIFPEGTRTNDAKKTKYKSGIYTIAKERFCKIIPVSLNSGKFWPKGSFIKYPGIIKVEFLPEISEWYDKDSFMKKLEYSIENSYANLE